MLTVIIQVAIAVEVIAEVAAQCNRGEVNNNNTIIGVSMLYIGAMLGEVYYVNRHAEWLLCSHMLTSHFSLAHHALHHHMHAMYLIFTSTPCT